MAWIVFATILLLFTAIMFTFLTHPLALGLTLIFQTTLICSALIVTSKFPWISYILFLVFLGATLVLFTYVAALASNESFSMKMSVLATLIMMVFIISPILALGDPETILPTNYQNFYLCTPQIDSCKTTLTSIYTLCNMPLLGVIILYLLFTLIVVVKVSYSFFGPLRLS